MTTSPPMSVRSVLSASLLVVVAMVVVYFGLAVSVSLIQANHDAKAVVAMVAYLGMTVAVPVIVGVIRSGGDRRIVWAVRTAALVSLAAQVVFVPVALAVFAM